jgi:hypothetical protein
LTAAFELSSSEEEMSGKRQRATRLSSGSVKKRSYVDEADSDEDIAGLPSSTEEENSDSEEDFKPEKKSKRGNGVKAAKRDSPSSEDFTEDEEASDEDIVTEEEGEIGGVIIDSDEEEEISTSSRKKFKAESHQEVIEVKKAPKGKSECAFADSQGSETVLTLPDKRLAEGYLLISLLF